MIRLADFQRDFAALLTSNLLDQLTQQPLRDATTSGRFRDDDVFQFPRCVDSVGYEECKDSRSCRWNSLRLSCTVIFGDPGEALRFLICFLIGFPIRGREQRLILIPRPVAGSRVLAFQVHYGGNVSRICPSNAHARIESSQASRRRCGECSSPPTGRARPFRLTESCASPGGQCRRRRWA